MASDSARRKARRNSARNTTGDLGARVLVAIPAIAFALFIISAGGWIFVAGVAALGFACLGELFTMLRHGHPVRFAGFIGLAGILVAAQLGGPDAVLGALAACVPLMFVIGVLQPRAGAAGLSVTALAFMWIAIALAHAVLLSNLDHGGAIIVDALVGTFLGDTGAYLGGRAIGRTKLAASISPNKTVEGLAIGMVVAVVAVWFAGLYQDWLSGTDALILGAAIAVAAPLGDLFESYLKRDAGTKDTGRLFGAHGGALDRLDAVLFSVPVAYYVWTALS